MGKTAELPKALQGVLRGLEGCVDWCVAYGGNCFEGGDVDRRVLVTWCLHWIATTRV